MTLGRSCLSWKERFAELELDDVRVNGEKFFFFGGPWGISLSSTISVPNTIAGS